MGHRLRFVEQQMGRLGGPKHERAIFDGDLARRLVNKVVGHDLEPQTSGIGPVK